MMIYCARFPAASQPLEPILQALREELGPGARNQFDAIEVRADMVRLDSMDPIAIVYAAKVLAALGATPVSLGGDEVARASLPDWSQSPWTSYGLSQRLRIRFARFLGVG